MRRAVGCDPKTPGRCFSLSIVFVSSVIASQGGRCHADEIFFWALGWAMVAWFVGGLSIAIHRMWRMRALLEERRCTQAATEEAREGCMLFSFLFCQVGNKRREREKKTLGFSQDDGGALRTGPSRRRRRWRRAPRVGEGDE